MIITDINNSKSNKMNKNKKQEYTSPKVKVVSFLIERGFAPSDLTTDKQVGLDKGTQKFASTSLNGDEGYF